MPALGMNLGCRIPTKAGFCLLIVQTASNQRSIATAKSSNVWTRTRRVSMVTGALLKLDSYVFSWANVKERTTASQTRRLTDLCRASTLYYSTTQFASRLQSIMKHQSSLKVRLVGTCWLQRGIRRCRYKFPRHFLICRTWGSTSTAGLFWKRMNFSSWSQLQLGSTVTTIPESWISVLRWILIVLT